MGRSNSSAHSAPTGWCLVLLSTLLACNPQEVPQEETNRLWGTSLREDNVVARATEELHPRDLIGHPQRIRRVLSMSIDEVVERLGSFSYHGVAQFTLAHQEQQVEVFEDTEIIPGSNGGWQVIQRDTDQRITREAITLPDKEFVRNGTGKLRRRRTGDLPSDTVREEAFSPLSTFTSWFGDSLVFKQKAPSRHQRQPAVAYTIGLKPRATAHFVPELKAHLRPLSLRGRIVVHADSGAPLRAQMVAALEVVPSEPPGHAAPSGEEAAVPGRLDLQLRMNMKVVPRRPIIAENYVPPIVGRPLDLDPLGFLQKYTKTSTVIGGTSR